MRTAPLESDLVLSARLATPDAFAPFGRVLQVGSRARLGRPGGVLAVLHDLVPGPVRFQTLERYLDSRRLLLPHGEAAFWMVVALPGESSTGLPVAFLTVPGQGLLLKRGVWHAGPVPTARGRVVEILETAGPALKVDRRPFGHFSPGHAALRIRLQEEPSP